MSLNAGVKMNINTKIIVALVLIVFLQTAEAHDAPSIYFNESEINMSIGNTRTLELRMNTTESCMGAEAQIWHNTSCVRVTNVSYDGAPWKPLSGTGWSYQQDYAKLAAVNWDGVPPGDHLFALVEIEMLQNSTSVLELRHPQPSNLITYDTTIRSDTMNNKTIVALIAFTVMVTGAMAADVSYTVSVYEGQNTSLTVNMADFGPMTRGSTGEINNSLTFVNDGDMNASVDAMFTSSVGTVYGMVSETNTIPGNEFSLGPDMAEVALMADGTSRLISTVPSGATVGYDATLNVPATTVTGAYTGNVQVTYG